MVMYILNLYMDLKIDCIDLEQWFPKGATEEAISKFKILFWVTCNCMHDTQCK